MPPPRKHARGPAKKSSASVEVRNSRIQGRGVFATRDIPKGRRILEYGGERISHDEATRRYDDTSQRRHHTFLFTVDEEIVIDGAKDGNEARFINHSCAPNCESLIRGGRVFIYAIQNIGKGAELLYDYWYSTDPGYTDLELKALYPCRCGARRCRGTLAAPKRKKKR